MSKKSTKINYRKLTLKYISEADYKREYTTYAARVRNFNRAAGTNVSAAQMFYYSKRYADNLSPRQIAIAQTPATRSRVAGTYPISHTAENVASAQIFKDWEGAITKSAHVRYLWESYNRGELTLAEFSRLAQKWSNDRREKLRDGDPTVGS